MSAILFFLLLIYPLKTRALLKTRVSRSKTANGLSQQKELSSGKRRKKRRKTQSRASCFGAADALSLALACRRSSWRRRRRRRSKKKQKGIAPPRRPFPVLFPAPRARKQHSLSSREERRGDEASQLDERGRMLSLSLSLKLPSPLSSKKRRRQKKRESKREQERGRRSNFFSSRSTKISRSKSLPLSLRSLSPYLLCPRLLGLRDVDSCQRGHEVADVAEGAVEKFFFEF